MDIFWAHGRLTDFDCWLILFLGFLWLVGLMTYASKQQRIEQDAADLDAANRAGH